MRRCNKGMIASVIALSVGAAGSASGQVIRGRASEPPRGSRAIGVLLERRYDILEQQAEMERMRAASCV